MVITLLEAAEDEAGQSIKEAYQKGYKMGLLDAAPERDFWQARSQLLERELNQNKKQAQIRIVLSVGAGIAVGAGITAAAIFLGGR